MRTSFALSLLVQIGAAFAQGPAPSSQASCDNCGVVQSIQTSTQEEQWTPLGSVATGSTPTSGGTESRSMFAFDKKGKREMVTIGAAGGAVYAKRPTSYQRTRWDVTINMDAGGTRVVQQRYEPFVREGDHVRVQGTQIELVDP
jgi:hypothetical protein